MSQALALAALCDGLGAIFAEPLSEARVEALQSAQGAALLAELGEVTGLVAQVRALVAALGTDDPVGTAAAIGRAHVLLFSGAAGPGTVAPYESVHTSDAGLLFQRPAADMQALLAQLDLDPVRLPGEPPDHIAVELAVLAEALRRDDAATAARLLHHHLLRWAPDFAELCQAHDPHGLYAAAAALLTPLLHRACDLIQAPANPPSMKENVP